MKGEMMESRVFDLERYLFRKVMTVLLLSGVLLLPGCHLLRGQGKARVLDFVPGESVGSSAIINCWMTIKFLEYPEGINRRDVKIVFRGDALQENLEYDWAFISKADQVRKESGWGRVPLTSTNPNTDPELGREIDINFRLNPKIQVEKRRGEALWVYAELWWGGVRQDYIKRDISHVYTWE